MPARFHEIDITAALKNKRKLSAYLDELALSGTGKNVRPQLNYIFCSDDYLLKLNKEFLNHDTFTDIVTFDLSEKGNELIGEIYISVERVKENAAKFGVQYQEELHRVIFHGALHLCGYKDKTAAQKKEMREQEDRCLKEYLMH